MYHLYFYTYSITFIYKIFKHTPYKSAAPYSRNPNLGLSSIFPQPEEPSNDLKGLNYDTPYVSEIGLVFYLRTRVLPGKVARSFKLITDLQWMNEEPFSIAGAFASAVLTARTAVNKKS